METGREIERLADGCLAHLLGEDGHTVYFRDPDNRERMCMGIFDERHEAIDSQQKFRRILLRALRMAYSIGLGHKREAGA